MNADGPGKTNLTRSPERYDLSDWQPIPGPRGSDYKNANQFTARLSRRSGATSLASTTRTSGRA
jgi:hypothetical protein